MYNLEQIRKYIRYPVTPIHRKALNQCIAILDYSQRNCEEYPPRLKQKTYFFPMPFTFISDKERIEPYMKGKAGSIGVLFFGSVNARRQNIVDHLRKSSGGRYNIVAGASFFGEELCEMVKRSKIILNLHFRPKNSLLETCRIHDCLTFGNAHIISEEPASDENETRERYANVVEYIPVIKNDLSNIKALEKRKFSGNNA